MSKLKNTFGFTGSLLDTIKGVYEAAKAPGIEAREKIKNVPRQEGDEDLRARQGEIQRKVVDEALKGNQHKIDVAEPKGKITKADFDKLRSMKKEEVEQIDELKHDTLRNYMRKARGQINVTSGKKKEKRVQGYRHAWAKADAKVDKGQYEEVEYVDEADKTYPFKANQLAPMMTQLRALIKFLGRSGVLKSLMREDYALYEVYMGEKFDADSLQVMLEDMEDLLEGRPKGSKNKPKGGSAPAASAPKSSGEHHGSDDEAPAYKSASGHDSGHIMAQLTGAMDVGGRHISTAKGHKYVSGHTASKIHNHLMGLKAPERAEASSRIYHMDDSHPAVKAIHADHEASVKRGVAVPGEKRGRGRPKKNA